MEVALVWIVAICCSTVVASLAVASRGDKELPEARLARRFAAGEISEGEFLIQLNLIRDAVASRAGELTR